jgi:hypothetical protein
VFSGGGGTSTRDTEVMAGIEGTYVMEEVPTTAVARRNAISLELALPYVGPGVEVRPFLGPGMGTPPGVTGGQERLGLGR